MIFFLTQLLGFENMIPDSVFLAGNNTFTLGNQNIPIRNIEIFRYSKYSKYRNIEKFYSTSSLVIEFWKWKHCSFSIVLWLIKKEKRKKTLFVFSRNTELQFNVYANWNYLGINEFVLSLEILNNLCWCSKCHNFHGEK